MRLCMLLLFFSIHFCCCARIPSDKSGFVDKTTEVEDATSRVKLSTPLYNSKQSTTATGNHLRSRRIGSDADENVTCCTSENTSSYLENGTSKNETVVERATPKILGSSTNHFQTNNNVTSSTTPKAINSIPQRTITPEDIGTTINTHSPPWSSSETFESNKNTGEEYSTKPTLQEKSSDIAIAKSTSSQQWSTSGTFESNKNNTILSAGEEYSTNPLSQEKSSSSVPISELSSSTNRYDLTEAIDNISTTHYKSDSSSSPPTENHSISREPINVVEERVTSSVEQNNNASPTPDETVDKTTNTAQSDDVTLLPDKSFAFSTLNGNSSEILKREVLSTTIEDQASSTTSTPTEDKASNTSFTPTEVQPRNSTRGNYVEEDEKSSTKGNTSAYSGNVSSAERTTPKADDNVTLNLTQKLTYSATDIGTTSTPEEYSTNPLSQEKSSSYVPISELSSATNRYKPIETTPSYENNVNSTISSTPNTSTSRQTPEDIGYINITNIETSSTTISLRWSYSGKVEPNFIIEYNNSKNSTTYGNITITELKACTTYNITIYPTSGNVTGLPVNIIQYIGQSEINVPVNFTLEEHENSLRVKWNHPDRYSSCTLLYQVVWMAGKDINSGSTNETEYTIRDITPCESYQLQVFLFYNETHYPDNSKSKSVFTKAQPATGTLEMSAPNISDREVEIKFKVNKCNFTEININCVSDQNETWIVRNMSKNFNVTHKETQTSIEVKSFCNIFDNNNTTKDFLSPFTNYYCSASYFDEDKSQETKFNISTKQMKPGLPRNLAIEIISEKEFKLSWEDPCEKNGILKAHHIEMKYIKTKYLPIPTCNKEYNSNQSNTVDADKHESILRVQPATEYNIWLQSENQAGKGKSNTINDSSLETAPSAPENVSIIINPEETKNPSMVLSWSIPCKMNGNLKKYVILVNGESYEVAADKTKYMIRNLTFDADISGKITAWNSKEGEAEKFNGRTLAGIPEIHDNFTLPIIYNEDPRKYRLNLADLVSKSRGKLRFYMIIVAEEGCQEEQKKGFYHRTLPKLTVKPGCEDKIYETCDPIVWPLDDVVKYIIGQGEGKNRALEEDKQYRFKLRIFTGNSYADTRNNVFYIKPECSLPAVIIGAVITVMVSAFLIVLILYCRKTRVYIRWLRRKSNNNDSPVPGPVSVQKFPTYFKNMSSSCGRISSQFQLLQTLSIDIPLSKKEGTLILNKKKNRYVNIIPYDENRVILQKTPTNPSDYINASFIKGYSGKVEYIAAQGPTENTMNAFWQMCYEQDVRIIIMLTGLVEQGKDKCFKYYPDPNEDEYLDDDSTVQTIKECDYEIYTVRVIRMTKGDESKQITHLYFKKWPDFGVPADAATLLEFIQIVKEMLRKNPGMVVVHCSAGVGRTGTLIAADILMQSIRNKRKVDIFGTVYKLRNQRVNMVQTEAQYEFLYKCVLHMIQKTEQMNKNLTPIEETIM